MPMSMFSRTPPSGSQYGRPNAPSFSFGQRMAGASPPPQAQPQTPFGIGAGKPYSPTTGFNPGIPTDNPISPEMAGQARDTVQNVGNSARTAFANMPSMSLLPPAARAAMQAQANRAQIAGGQRNRAALDVQLATEPLEHQLQRQDLGSQVSLDHLRRALDAQNTQKDFAYAGTQGKQMSDQWKILMSRALMG